MDKELEENILWIVTAKTKDHLYKEIQLVTKDKQYAIDFVENNYCDFQEHMFKYAYIQPFMLEAYLGEIDDYIKKDENELILNPKWLKLKYIWDEDTEKWVQFNE